MEFLRVGQSILEDSVGHGVLRTASALLRRVLQQIHGHQGDRLVLAGSAAHHCLVRRRLLQRQRRQRDGGDWLLPQLAQSDWVLGGSACCHPRGPAGGRLAHLQVGVGVCLVLSALAGVCEGVWRGVVRWNVDLCCSWSHTLVITRHKQTR